MALYRTLIRSEQLGDLELLREYKPHKRTIMFGGTPYYLSLPYMLFYMNYDYMPDWGSHKAYVRSLCIAFAKKPIKSFSSKVYAPMLPNVYNTLKEVDSYYKSVESELARINSEETIYYDFDLWYVCTDDYNDFFTMDEAVKHFWNSSFNRDGSVGFPALRSNYNKDQKLLRSKTRIENIYQWWEDLRKKPEGILKHDGCTLNKFTRSLCEYDCEYNFETGL
jgi:hypothetical protein